MQVQNNPTDTGPTWQLRYSLNLVDGSGQASAYAEWNVWSRVALFALGVIHHGGPRTEFHSLLSQSILVGARATSCRREDSAIALRQSRKALGSSGRNRTHTRREFSHSFRYAGEMIVRGEQLTALGSARETQFTSEMVTHLRSHFPREVDGLGDGELRIHIEESLTRARGYGLTSTQDTIRFLNLCASFGWHFDQEPSRPGLASTCMTRRLHCPRSG